MKISPEEETAPPDGAEQSGISPACMTVPLCPAALLAAQWIHWRKKQERADEGGRVDGANEGDELESTAAYETATANQHALQQALCWAEATSDEGSAVQLIASLDLLATAPDFIAPVKGFDEDIARHRIRDACAAILSTFLRHPGADSTLAKDAIHYSLSEIEHAPVMQSRLIAFLKKHQQRKR